MNIDLMNYIQVLSLRDKKNLSQKALKVSEECGELAKKVLPYDNAYATRHRFIEREHILEEVADTMLCAMSIAYDLEYSTEDLEKMLLKKTNKWTTLQNQESEINFPCPFEIHLTVPAYVGRETLQEVCAEYSIAFGGKVKATALHLQDLDGKIIMDDLMTSEVHIGDNRSVLKRIESLVGFLQGCDIEVLRRKVETVPWHPAAPSKINGQFMPESCYFETHIDFDKAKVEPLIVSDFFRRLADKTPGVAFSVNSKRIDTRVGMTIRDYTGTKEEHIARVQNVKQHFDGTNSIIDEITEFAIFDTKILHDEAWMKRSSLPEFAV